MKNWKNGALKAFATALFLSATPVLAGSASVEAPLKKYDFGTVKQGAGVSHDFTVRNTGDSPLDFPVAQLSMPGMKVFLPPPILPGAEGKVRIEWNTAQVSGLVEGLAVLSTSDPLQPELDLSLAGIVVPPISVEPIPAVFLSTFIDIPAQQLLTIRNNEDAPLKITGVVPNPLVQTSLREVEPGRLFELNVSSTPGLRVGRYEGALEVTTNSPSRKTIRLVLFVWVKQDIYANPDTLDFGNISKSTFDPIVGGHTFYVKKKDGVFGIRSITSDSSLLNFEKTPNGPSEVFRVDVTLHPNDKKQGLHTALIRVETDDSQVPFVEVPVTFTIQ